MSDFDPWYKPSELTVRLARRWALFFLGCLAYAVRDGDWWQWGVCIVAAGLLAAEASQERPQ